ncbi:MAG: signal recognition particle-docking protein FtsY [Chlamydiae bacterium RIFCSPHIGHO2_12_FULL_49_11]|nr:MAG: signal recognition particle-docking protein FtsY [Chlamydiae bacterium RIFCSPHIGHO2_12_FULL_49_11]
MLQFFKSTFSKVSSALKRTKDAFLNKLQNLFAKPLDDETIEELESILYGADLGSEVTRKMIDAVRKSAPGSDLLHLLTETATRILEEPSQVVSKEAKTLPYLVLLVGINGSGKTTTCAKLAYKWKSAGKKVLVAALDTYRAAALEQLEVWTERLGLDLVKSQHGSAPSGVLFDALAKARAKGYDIVIADTAGRLESKSDLMKELGKLVSVAQKFDPDAPHDIFFVLDATTGQSAEHQIQVFREYVPLSGIIVTKLDGSARGGVILPVYAATRIPIRFIGLGEGKDDLEVFDAKNYTKALFSR